jgi:hypothetical protein
VIAPPDQSFGKNSFYRTTPDKLWVKTELTENCGHTIQENQVHVRRVKRWLGANTHLDKECDCVDASTLTEDKKPYIHDPIDIKSSRMMTS